jgi:hypothetical protein
MCPSADQHIHVHLSRQCGEHVGVTGWHYLLAMDNSYPDGLMGDGEGQGKVGVLR